MIKLPKIKHRKSGLRKAGKKWRVLYYEDGKLKTEPTGMTSLTDAIRERDKMHKVWVELHNATYSGGIKPALQAAIDNPEGMACIYEYTTYQVTVDGVTVTVTADPELARDRRNAYIKDNY